jgi:hypothetical protein
VRPTRLHGPDAAQMACEQATVPASHDERIGWHPEHEVTATRAPDAMTWRDATLRAGLILLLSLVGFMIVPDRLLAFLATRVEPTLRDALLVLWNVVFFVALAKVFVALQGRGPA